MPIFSQFNFFNNISISNPYKVKKLIPFHLKFKPYIILLSHTFSNTHRTEKKKMERKIEKFQNFIPIIEDKLAYNLHDAARIT